MIWRLSTLHKVQWREQRRKRAHENTDKDLLLRGIAAERCVFLLFDIRQPIPASFAIGFRTLITGAAGRAEHVDLVFRCRIVPYEEGDTRQL